MNTLYCCNSCGHVPDLGENRPYSLSSCGHVLCGSCCRRVQASGSICLVCQTECRLADMTHDPKPDIKTYFMDPLELLRESLNRVAKVCHFQNAQKLRYKTQMEKLMEEQKPLRKERDDLRNENAALKKKLETCEQREQGWIGNGVIASPHGGGNGFYVAPPPRPSPFFGAAADQNRPSPVHGVITTANFMNERPPVTNLNMAAGRITRPHHPTRPQAHATQRNSTVLSSTQRLFPSLFNGIGGRSTVYSTPGSAVSRVSSRCSNPTPRSTSNTTVRLLERLNNLSCNNNHSFSKR